MLQNLFYNKKSQGLVMKIADFYRLQVPLCAVNYIKIVRKQVERYKKLIREQGEQIERARAEQRMD